MRALISGISGFAGSHLARRLLDDRHMVYGVDLVRPSENLDDDVDWFEGDVTKIDGLPNVHPDVVFHLAAQSIPSLAASDPIGTIRTNVIGTANVILAYPYAKIVVASSADVYGAPALPFVDERTPVHPRNIYAASKVAAEAFCGDAVVLRPTNHIGPRQREELVASSFAKQIVHDGRVFHGDLSARRDFIDVRDMADAYVRAATLPSGVYTVGSGKAVAIQEILDTLIDLSGKSVRCEVDPDRLRPGQSFSIDSTKFRRATGWEPKIPLRTSLEGLLDWWRSLPRPTVAAVG